MGKILVVMGKSASGKDSIYSRLKSDYSGKLKNVVIYTTRPMRDNESEGREYHFQNEKMYDEAVASGKVIEQRTYNTVFGPWHYYTVDDGQFDDDNDCLMIGTLEAYESVRDYFGDDRVVPVYIEVDDYTRLSRALIRERNQKKPSYSEMCRRFLADCEDFSEEKLERAGIKRRFVNDNFDTCINEIKQYIDKVLA